MLHPKILSLKGVRMLSWHILRLCKRAVLLSFVLPVLAGCAKADTIHLVSRNEQLAARPRTQEIYVKHVLPYAKSRTVSLGKQGSAPQVFFEQSSFVWSMGETKIVTMVGGVSDDVSPIPDCRPDAGNPFDDRCDWARWRSSSCYLFVHQMSGTMIGAYRIQPYVRQSTYRGRPRCSGVYAVAEAKQEPGGILLTVGFSDSMADADAKHSTSVMKETFLFVPVISSDGVSFAQEGACLGQQPPIPSIAAAREALRACAGH